MNERNHVARVAKIFGLLLVVLSTCSTLAVIRSPWFEGESRAEAPVTIIALCVGSLLWASIGGLIAGLGSRSQHKILIGVFAAAICVIHWGFFIGGLFSSKGMPYHWMPYIAACTFLVGITAAILVSGRWRRAAVFLGPCSLLVVDILVMAIIMARK